MCLRLGRVFLCGVCASIFRKVISLEYNCCVMRLVRAKLEHGDLQTEWSSWIREVLHVFGQVDVMRPDTWKVLAPLAEPIAAVRWLVDQIQQGDAVPPKQPLEESKFYLLASFCPDNRVLGYLIDTYLHYYRTRNRLGVLSCVRIVATVNGEGYSHLNVLYNVMMGTMLREYRYHGPFSGENPDSTFLTDKDFRNIGRLLPDFHPFEFRERMQALQHKVSGNTTSEELARACFMSGSTFRKRFKREFGIPVSEWLRERRKERIKRMLLDTDIPLCHVAESNGFNMLSTFSDFCRRNFGRSPVQMRKMSELVNES